MLTRICACAVVLMAVPAWSQTGSSEEAPMVVPPPVSGQAYAATVGAEERSNFLNIGVVASGGYIENLYAGEATSVNDTLFSLYPTIALDQTTSRSHRMFTYAPGFSFYQPTSALNETDQNAVVGFRYKLSPHTGIELNDAFEKSSTSFNQPYGSLSGSVSGSLSGATPLVIAPFGERLTNTASAAYNWQYGLNSMIGFGGDMALLDYPNPSQTPGLYNSQSEGGSAFYTSRLSGSQYLGATYQYLRSAATPPGIAESITNSHSILASYTYYATPNLSFSVAGGPQYVQTSEAPLPTYQAWAPAGIASMNWRGLHEGFSASYARTVTAGQGLIGAFQSDTASATARWMIARGWTVGAEASYSISKTLSGALSTIDGGHAISGNATLQHSLGPHLSAGFEYDRLHDSYPGVAALSNNPNSSREIVTVSWHLSRPLGR